MSWSFWRGLELILERLFHFKSSVRNREFDSMIWIVPNTPEAEIYKREREIRDREILKKYAVDIRAPLPTVGWRGTSLLTAYKCNSYSQPNQVQRCDKIPKTIKNPAGTCCIKKDTLSKVAEIGINMPAMEACYKSCYWMLKISTQKQPMEHCNVLNGHGRWPKGCSSQSMPNALSAHGHRVVQLFVGDGSETSSQEISYRGNI